MAQAAQALSAVKLCTVDPNRMDMWVRGGRLMADDLGMLHALHWWQACRDIAPNDSTVVEMASILADMGEYAKARTAPIHPRQQHGRGHDPPKINSLLQLVRAAATQQEREIFKPYERHHDGWQAIQQMGKPPMSENFIFLITAVLFFHPHRSPSRNETREFQHRDPLNTLIILIVIMVCMRNAKRWFQIINRPAFNLLRAMNPRQPRATPCWMRRCEPRCFTCTSCSENRCRGRNGC